ncbi:toxic anion resistance protein [Nitrincola iocasae]|uniref:Toxic anion resistance protein n=1 Tax=Nitrincola iocasae TaxID=2614693 RepID=A0A5J6LEH4_9GAMM|nr:toxic anion resistance protein [Nitrincola iocasae]QEW06561.1 toxic anion resistance protein [Nitrincola iocasae]
MTEKPLSLASPEQLAQELDQSSVQRNTDDLKTEAQGFVSALLDEAIDRQREQIDHLGLEVQIEASRLTHLLNTPLEQLGAQGAGSEVVVASLDQLRRLMQELKPDPKALETTAMSRFLSRISVLQSPVKRYFKRFETAQDTLNSLIQGLEAGRDRLHRDNVTLGHDQQDMRTALESLTRFALLGQLVDDELNNKLQNNELNDNDKVFIEEELLFPLRQRILDLQQQQAVCQQGILAVEVVIRNNRELIRGVDRGLNVTLSALRVAVTVALALSNQKLVLDHIDALNDTTNEMIAGTAQALRQQGVTIQQRAASAQLDMQVLEQAFVEMQGALDDLSNYRQQALPVMQEQIQRMQALNTKGRSI